jgi:hypothetical protein
MTVEFCPKCKGTGVDSTGFYRCRCRKTFPVDVPVFYDSDSKLCLDTKLGITHKEVKFSDFAIGPSGHIYGLTPDGVVWLLDSYGKWYETSTPAGVRFFKIVVGPRGGIHDVHGLDTDGAIWMLTDVCSWMKVLPPVVEVRA